MPSTYTKKNGEVISYDCRKYNAEAYAKNKEKVLSDKYECQYCNVSLLKCNKSNHNKSKKHLLVVAYANKQNATQPATQPPEVLATRDALSSSNDGSLVADLCELEIR